LPEGYIRLDLEKMILNTTNKEPDIQNISYLYTQFDPKYLYPVNTSKTGYNITTDMYGLENLMLQRRGIIFSKIEMLNSEIYQRHYLKEANIYKINIDQCTCKNMIYMMGDEFLDKKRLELEQKIIDLEQEKRREKVNCFRDVLFLQKELRESLIERMEEEQKAALIMNQ